MTLRCRKGDLAIVIKGPAIGRIYEVARFLGAANDPVKHPGNDYWAVEYKGSPWNDKLEWLICRDSNMIPIRPGDLDESDEIEKTLEFQ